MARYKFLNSNGEYKGFRPCRGTGEMQIAPTGFPGRPRTHRDFLAETGTFTSADLVHLETSTPLPSTSALPCGVRGQPTSWQKRDRAALPSTRPPLALH